MDNLDFRFGYDGLSPVPPPLQKKEHEKDNLGLKIYLQGSLFRLSMPV